MEEVHQSYQNGHSKTYKEVAEDGTVTEYQEEQYVIEDESTAGYGEDIDGKVVVLQDSDDIKVYQKHELLEDGREIITTTTITVDDNGEAMQETVTEVVESEEVEVEEEDEEEEESEEEEVEVEEEEVVEEEVEEEVDEVVEPEVVAGKEGDEDDEDSTVSAEVTDTFVEQQTTDETESTDLAQPVKTVSRRISYEEFAEQYTEYKPPKRYEKKQTTTTADKAAPKIRIMGLPNADSYTGAAVAGSDTVVSPRTSTSGDDSAEMSMSSQPTRTQGSIIRSISRDGTAPRRGGRTRSRYIMGHNQAHPNNLPGFLQDQAWMDQDSCVDPANIVRSDYKPDMEAELPSRGTSHSLKNKFQALGGGDTRHIDYSQPVKQEKPKTNQDRSSVGAVVADVQSDHREPEFEGGEIENNPEVRQDVVREADKNDQEELPELGQARSLLSKWSQIEVESSSRKEYKPSGVGSKPTVTPLRPSRVDNVNSGSHVEPELEGGEYENTPVERTDVIKESDTVDLEQELPSIGLAKSLMSQFKRKEEEAKKTPAYQPSGAGYRAPKVNTRTSSVSSSEPHIEPQFEGGAVENVPVPRADVVRESDSTENQELPEAGYAKSLKARFRELQEQQKPADYVEHRPSGVANKATPTPNRLSNPAALSTSITSLSAEEQDTRVEPQLEGGEYESQPIKRTDVVREEDTVDGEELPEAGLAKNLMNRFKSLENEKPPSYKPSGVGSKSTRTPLGPQAAVDLVEIANEETVVPAPEMGAWESTPIIREDVVRESDTLADDDLPYEGVTRSLQSQYRELTNQQTLAYTPSGVSRKPTPTPLRPRPSVDLVEIINQETVMPAPEMGAWENIPVIREDVVRESDTLAEDDLPCEGVTRSLQSQYHELTNQQTPAYTPSGVSRKPTPTPLRPRPSVDLVEIINQETVMPAPEMGAWENIPVIREDVVRESDTLAEDDLPCEGVTRNLQSQYHELTNQQTPVYTPSGVSRKPTPTPLRPRPSVDLVEIINQETVMPAPEMGAWENIPVIREDVVRESDTLAEDDLPYQGVTRNLQSQYHELTNQQTPVYTPSGVSRKPTPTPLRPQPSVDRDEIINQETVMPAPEMGSWESVPLVLTNVKRETDALPKIFLPTEGLTRNRQTQYRVLTGKKTTAHTPSGVGSKATPSKLHIMAGKTSYSAKGIVPEPVVNSGEPEKERVVEAGEYENTPAVRDDVVRADTRVEENELPERGVTKNTMSRFKSIEVENKSTVEHRPSKVASKPTPTPLRPTSAALDVNDSTSETSSTDRLEPEVEKDESVEVNHNVIRSTDSNQNEYIPSAGAAKNILDKFKQMETQKGDRVEHRPSKVASSLTPTPLQMKR